MASEFVTHSEMNVAPFPARFPALFLRLAGVLVACLPVRADEVNVPTHLQSSTLTGQITTSGSGAAQIDLQFEPSPATEEYSIEFAPHLHGAFNPVGSVTNGFRWAGPVDTGDSGFYRVDSKTLSTNDLLATTLLHRIAYGPTPDELGRVRQMGPDAYIAEQLTGETIVENLDAIDPTPRWQKVSATGLGSASRLYLYTDGPGDIYLDDLRLVAGATDDGTQSNLLRNGGFESTLGTDWNLSPNVVGSARTTEFVHSGSASLHLVATEAGQSQGSSIYQIITPSLNASQTYTLTYWYRTSTQGTRLTIRLSGSGITSSHDLSGEANSPAPLYAKLSAGTASRADLRAWHVLRALKSKRQLHEVLRQFLENHFVTQVSKTQDYFDGRGYDTPDPERLSVRTEFVENRRWREALLRPDVTFLDLLKISAESPAMIVYLDTVTSRGDGNNVANENYARELCELFCFGVDNGYDQQDIVQISKAWTGWRLDILTPENEFNPLAPRSTTYKDPNATGTGLNANTNVLGTWSFRYRTDRHNNNAKSVFYNWDAAGAKITSPKHVPARFGPPWAGRDYSLTLPARSGAAGLQDGYDILAHMANQPFTEEFISVKLCRLLVHDGFALGYDFTDDATTPEEDLVKQCMLAWENSNPKGQIREVLKVILNSDLFRSHAASLQKARTPLEFAVATIRALRAQKPDGSFTAETDGYEVYNFMNRAGRMRLFDRAEPDGYPEDAPGWISAGTLAERLRFVQSALMPPGMSGKEDAGVNTRIDVLGLLQRKLDSAGQRDAGAVADLFLGLLFPAEGRANLATYRQLAIQYLNTADDGTTSSPWSNLSPGSTLHDQRLRGLVGFLLSTQRFQEQ